MFQLNFFYDQGALELYTYFIDIVIPYTTIYIVLGLVGIRLVWKNR